MSLGSLSARLVPALLLGAVLLPARAEAQRCISCPPAPPTVNLTPGVATTDAPTIELTITWWAEDIQQAARQLLPSGAAQVTMVEDYPDYQTNTLTSRVTVALAPGGTGDLVARITDHRGNVTEGFGRYTSTRQDPSVSRRAPSVTLLHHDGYRDAAMGSVSIGYSTPAYVSRDQPRSVSLVQHSGQALLDEFLQMDVFDSSQDKAPLLSLSVTEVGTGVRMPLRDGDPYEYWVATGNRRVHRIGTFWTQNRPTGDYKYVVTVRAHWPDQVLETQHTIRMLTTDQRASPFGWGWSMAGLQKITPGRYGDGVVMEEGDGVVRFFAADGCGASGACTYQSPEGDFTTLERTSGGAWIRRFPDGSYASFHVSGLLDYAQDRFGSITDYEWGIVGGRSALMGIVDPALLRTTFVYGPSGLLAEIVDPAGRRSRFTHDGNGDVVSIQQPDGSYAFRDATWAGAHMLNGYVDERGGQYTIGHSHRRLGVIHGPAVPSGAGTVRETTRFMVPQNAAMPTTGPTSRTAPAQSIDADSAWSWVEDHLGNRTRYRVDRYGNTTRSISPAGEVTDVHHNRDGLPGSVWRDGRAVATYGWWRGRVASVEDHQTGEKTSVVYDLGGLPTMVSRNGVSTWHRYHPNGAIRKSWTGAEADSTTRVTTYLVDGRGRISEVRPPDGLTTTYVYQSTGWQNAAFVSQRRKVGTSLQYVTTSFGYDAYGRRSAVTTPDGQSTTTFDLLNRPLVLRDPRGKETGMAYLGPDLQRVTDASGKAYQWTRDAAGATRTETFPDGSSRSFTYDVLGRQTASTDRRGRVVTFAYDGASRLVRRIAGSDTTWYEYPVQPEYRKHVQVTVVRNGLSIDTIQTELGSASGPEMHSATFGGRTYRMIRERVPQFGEHHRDLRVSASISGGAEQWSHLMRFRFGQPFSAYAGGRTDNVYDFGGRVHTFDRDAAGRLRRTVFPGGVEQHHVYDEHRRPSRASFNTSALTSALGANYLYDAMGRLTSRSAVAGGGGREFRYDAAGQLVGSDSVRTTRVAPDWCKPNIDPGCEWIDVREVVSSQNFTYDDVGNRTDGGATLLPGGNRYATFNGFHLTYDAEGNLVRKYRAGVIDQTLTWDDLGRLVSVTTNGAMVTYGYNGLGQRIRRADASGVTWSLYDGDDLLMELNGSHAPLRTYTYGPGTDRPLSVTVGHPVTGTTYLYVLDQPGHVVAVLNTAGTVVNRYTYQPFGEPAAGTSQGFAQPLQFMARELDAATGLYYVRARWYDPQLARFVSEDPIGLEGGINTYAYAFNDPMNLRDPTGLYPDSPSCSRRSGHTWSGVLGSEYFFECEPEEPWYRTSLRSMADLINQTRACGGCPLGSLEGQQALDYWASRAANGSGLAERGPGYLMGSLAALWTPDTATETGVVLIASLAGGAAITRFREAGYSTHFMTYPNAKGVGITIKQFGRRVAGLDWHGFELNGVWVNRLHYHWRRPGPGGGVGRHRPWEGW